MNTAPLTQFSLAEMETWLRGVEQLRRLPREVYKLADWFFDPDFDLQLGLQVNSPVDNVLLLVEHKALDPEQVRLVETIIIHGLSLRLKRLIAGRIGKDTDPLLAHHYFALLRPREWPHLKEFFGWPDNGHKPMEGVMAEQSDFLTLHIDAAIEMLNVGNLPPDIVKEFMTARRRTFTASQQIVRGLKSVAKFWRWMAWPKYLIPAYLLGRLGVFMALGV